MTDALVPVPSDAVAVNGIVDDAEGDDGVLGHPGVGDDEPQPEESEHDEEDRGRPRITAARGGFDGGQRHTTSLHL